MANHKEHAELIKKAQLGDRESLSRLAEVARVHLREYVLRLTLQEDLTEDIVQESILEMFKVFDKLKKAEGFWAWLHGIAFNKIRSHYGRQWRHKTTSLSAAACEIATEDSQNARLSRYEKMIGGMVERIDKGEQYSNERWHKLEGILSSLLAQNVILAEKAGISADEFELMTETKVKNIHRLQVSFGEDKNAISAAKGR